MGQTNETHVFHGKLFLVFLGNLCWVTFIVLLSAPPLYTMHIFLGAVLAFITMGIWIVSYCTLYPPKWLQDYSKECELRETARRILEKCQQEELEKIVAQLKTSKNE